MKKQQEEEEKRRLQLEMMQQQEEMELQEEMTKQEPEHDDHFATHKVKLDTLRVSLNDDRCQDNEQMTRRQKQQQDLSKPQSDSKHLLQHETKEQKNSPQQLDADYTALSLLDKDIEPQQKQHGPPYQESSEESNVASVNKDLKLLEANDVKSRTLESVALQTKEAIPIEQMDVDPQTDLNNTDSCNFSFRKMEGTRGTPLMQLNHQLVEEIRCNSSDENQHQNFDQLADLFEIRSVDNFEKNSLSLEIFSQDGVNSFPQDCDVSNALNDIEHDNKKKENISINFCNFILTEN